MNSYLPNWTRAAFVGACLAIATIGCSSAPNAPSGQEPGTGSGGQQGMGGATPPAVVPGDLVCHEDADCTGDKRVCDPVEGCVACLYDWDCPAQHRCEDRECFAKTACKSEGDCSKDATRPVCDVVTQVCVECREDTDCGASMRCDLGVCLAFEACENSRDCSGGKVCDREAGACVACVVDGDCGESSACVDNACVPRCSTDKDCLGLGLLCDLDAGRCVECLGHEDCPGKYFCADSHTCELDVCVTGQARCESNSVLEVCNSVGNAFTGTSCSGDTGCQESGMTAACVAHECTPGAIECSPDHSAVVTCSADGFSVASTTPCPEGKACDAGTCKTVVCDPNAKSCDGSAPVTCNGSGTEKSYGQDCYWSGQACKDGLCQSQLCTPGESSCDGNVSRTCDDSGFGYTGVGTDCSSNGQVCDTYYGVCAPKVCEGNYDCQGSVLVHCLRNGAGQETIKDCGSAVLCDEAGAKCTTPKCTPGAYVCDGQVATRCNANGTGYEAGGTDCAAADLVCDGGGCLPKVCTPSTYFCDGGNPTLCSATGASYYPVDICSSYEYCKAGSGYCNYDNCSAGVALCSGNVATTCAADGSGPVAGGTNCSLSNQVCDAGICKDVTCTPGSTSCIGEVVYTCNQLGTGKTLSKTCSSGQYCYQSGSAASCVTDICTAGATGCNGEVVSTCGANGGSWTNPGTNCALAGQVCTSGGVCSASEVFSQGSATYSWTVSSPLIGGAFRALTNRKLNQIEAYLSVPGLQKLTWVVYEKGEGSNYSLVYQKVAAQKVPSESWVSSGALDYTLTAGKYYLIGLHVQGTATVYYSYYSGYLAGSLIAEPFGVLNTYSGDQPPSPYSFSSYYNSYLRFTTVVAN